MKTKIEILKEHKSKEDRKAFNDSLNKILPQLRKYARNRLRIARAKKRISAGVYSADDIVDEVFLIAYESLIDDVADERNLKVKLFKSVDEVISRLMDKSGVQDKVNIEDLIKEEMEVLEENYSVEADGHLVMMEELDDISYHLDDEKPKIFILDSESEDNILKSLNMEDADLSGDMDKRKVLGKTYEELPDFSRDIFDLYTHAKLTVEEIAEIKSTSSDNVTQILEQVKFRIKSVF